MKTRFVLVSLLAGLLGMLLASSAQAASLAELQKRFKARYPDLVKAKTDGKVGETYEGIVDAVKPDYLKDKELKKLVDEESADRRTLYELMAKSQNTTPEKVAERNRIRNFEKAKSGEYLRDKDQKWEKKK